MINSNSGNDSPISVEDVHSIQSFKTINSVGSNKSTYNQVVQQYNLLNEQYSLLKKENELLNKKLDDQAIQIQQILTLLSQNQLSI